MSLPSIKPRSHGSVRNKWSYILNMYGQERTNYLCDIINTLSINVDNGRLIKQ